MSSGDWCSGSPNGSAARSSASGLITRDIENAYLDFDPGEEPPMHGLLGSSITYRIATGPREGQKVFTLQTLPRRTGRPAAGGCRKLGVFLARGPRRDSPGNVTSSNA